MYKKEGNHTEFVTGWKGWPTLGDIIKFKKKTERIVWDLLVFLLLFDRVLFICSVNELYGYFFKFKYCRVIRQFL
jgi:hypothetical protein